MIYKRIIKYRRKKDISKEKKNGRDLGDLLSYIGKSYWQAVKR